MALKFASLGARGVRDCCDVPATGRRFGIVFRRQGG
jgi:hypothetical protein